MSATQNSVSTVRIWSKRLIYISLVLGLIIVSCLSAYLFSLRKERAASRLRDQCRSNVAMVRRVVSEPRLTLRALSAAYSVGYEMLSSSQSATDVSRAAAEAVTVTPPLLGLGWYS